jgi:hypothetical protein
MFALALRMADGIKREKRNPQMRFSLLTTPMDAFFQTTEVSFA